MKMVLPIPEQEGFRVCLPERVRFPLGIKVEYTPCGLKLGRNGFILDVIVPPASRESLVRALGPDKSGMNTRGLSVSWRQLLEKIALSGMLTDASPSVQHPHTTYIPALTALTELFDAIYEESCAQFPAGHALNKLIAGELTQSMAVAWLIENYHYTKSARYHVAPVLNHDMDSSERALWERFLKDESWHWRIYRPAFSQFQLSTSEVDDRRPLQVTSRFIETLRSAAETSPVAYAAAMMFIEQPPLSMNLEEDPLYTSLMEFYGFSLDSIRPLWWHATENLTAGHSALGAVVISNRKSICRRELNIARDAVRDTVHAVGVWHEAILGAK
ncbi:hypothetical protein O3S80_40915 [Streptomyces sp. Lzd4kr]|nr:hypothetical protein [Streptomyces sp. Lzd4kr]